MCCGHSGHSRVSAMDYLRSWMQSTEMLGATDGMLHGTAERSDLKSKVNAVLLEVRSTTCIASTITVVVSELPKYAREMMIGFDVVILMLMTELTSLPIAFIASGFIIDAISVEENRFNYTCYQVLPWCCPEL
eukprot:751525-Amphidinium_carterae.1